MQAQQLQTLQGLLAQPLSAMDEAIVNTLEGLWQMALAAGGEREAMLLQMQEESKLRRQKEMEAEAAGVAAREAAAEAARVEAERKAEAEEGMTGFRRCKAAALCP